MAVAHDVEEVLLLIKDSDRLSAEHVAEVRHLTCTLKLSLKNAGRCIFIIVCVQQRLLYTVAPASGPRHALTAVCALLIACVTWLTHTGHFDSFISCTIL